MTTFNDDELAAILADDSKPIVDSGASAQKNETEEAVKAATDKAAADAAASEALEAGESKRAKERIEQLVSEKKATEAKVAELQAQLNTSNSTDIDKFINSIQDEPSRNLLKTFGNLIREDINKKVNPVVDNYQNAQFEKEFAQFGDKIPELAAHKEDIRKTYLRNPSLGIKPLVGDVLLDIQTSKIKPIENSVSIANRDKQDIKDASKEDLYAMLETKPPIN